jgi:hypothetical protein
LGQRILFSLHFTSTACDHARTHARIYHRHTCARSAKKAVYAMQAAMHACAYIYLVTAGRAVCMYVSSIGCPAQGIRDPRRRADTAAKSVRARCLATGNRHARIFGRVGVLHCLSILVAYVVYGALWPPTDPRTQHPPTSELKSRKGWWR